MSQLRLSPEKTRELTNTMASFVRPVYGGVFLSLGCFQSCLDRIEPTMSQFLESMGDTRAN